MPRVKSAPVRREVHRFHQSSQVETSTADDLVEIDDEIDASQDTEEDTVIPLSPKSKRNRRTRANVECVWLEVDEDSEIVGEPRTLVTLAPGPSYLALCSHLVRTPCVEKDSSLSLDMVGNILLIRLDDTYLSGFCLLPKLRKDLLELLAAAEVIFNVIPASQSTRVVLYIRRDIQRLPVMLLQCFLWVAEQPPVWYDQNLLSHHMSFDADELLREVERNSLAGLPSSNRDISAQLQLLGVNTALRPYQLQGIRWMLDIAMGQEMVRDTAGWLPLELASADGSRMVSVLYSPLFECIVDAAASSGRMPSAGCILADEMGIGKSLQIIGLILMLKHRASSNTSSWEDASALVVEHITALQHTAASSNTSRRAKRVCLESIGIDTSRDVLNCLCGSDSTRKRDLGWIQCHACMKWRHIRCSGFTSTDGAKSEKQFTCLACNCAYHHSNPVTSNTTLILMPNTLLNQWQAEIRKHVPNTTSTKSPPLSVFVYDESVAAKKKRVLHEYSPRELSKHDVILMSFKTLRQGFYSSNVDWTEGAAKQLNNDVFPPPFLCMKFRTIVVDETQNIEGASECHALQMACKLLADFRISVSGTPFGSNSLSDLLSLAQFLRIPPFAEDRATWRKLISHPVLPLTAQFRLNCLQAMFVQRMIRRSKISVQAQLGLPYRATLIRSLVFSPFEVRMRVYCSAFVNF